MSFELVSFFSEYMKLKSKHLDLLNVGLVVLGVWHRPRSEGAATLSRSQPEVLSHMLVLIGCSPTCNDIFYSQLMVLSR